MEVVVKLPYFASVHMGDLFNPDSRSIMWAKIRCVTPNSISTSPTAIRVGSFVAWAPMATYNGSNRAALDAWYLAEISEWRFTACGTMIETDDVGPSQPYGRFPPEPVFPPIF